MGAVLSACWVGEEDEAAPESFASASALLGRKGQRPLGVLSVGVIGTGRSSVINTLLNRADACHASGGQLRGTRGCSVHRGERSAPIEDEPALELDFVDCEGLRSDQPVRAEELYKFIELLKPALEQFPGGGISHVFVTLDVEERQNHASVHNLLALTELFREVRERCYLCITRFNTNSVQAQWNNELLAWTRANRRAATWDELSGAPPSPSSMMHSYRAYIDEGFSGAGEAGAKAKLEQLLRFFDDRVIWMYNLDNMQQEDRADGELPPHEEYLYRFYRAAAIRQLVDGDLGRFPSEKLRIVEHKESLNELASACVLQCSDVALI
eukprot:CAMPEP_0202105456 /NCGR_PEP_ID=MMETSP0965-20130614/6050_1 /ASSEMBLY_ACC=CAM_ASM_000507 /TAXON_ID=4773 /ORGANISM="Schizochytrium aggregatum, Strain ATCC28209" /LENGTH=325 /DNA_ID=CAMNT_0048674359 /DNA_START=15 /DNA_END=992 /DNA_ORIENTATION=+